MLIYDAVARRLRKKGEAHSGRAGTQSWLRVNFPTAKEEGYMYTAQQGIPASRSAENKSAKAAKAESQGFKSAFVGVCWHKVCNQWAASISHDGTNNNLGNFIDEQGTARAFDEAARRLRKKGQAHGGRSGKQWLRLNFPTADEEAFGRGKGMPPRKKQKVRA